MRFSADLKASKTVIVQQQPKAVRLVAVVVTYNRLAQLKTTLARLHTAPETVLSKVVVVDNASTDGTGTWLAKQDKTRLDVLHLKTNTGGAGGFETGMRHVTAIYDPDWMVLMDDDARPEAGALETFVAHDRHAADAWAAAVYQPDGQICDINRPWQNPFWHRRVFWRTVRQGRDGFHLAPEDYATNRPLPLDGTSFVGFFVSRAGIARAGYPDAALFIYGDDVLYTLGLSSRGGRVLFDPGLRFEHDFSTQAKDDKRMRPLWKVYYHHRNLLMIYRIAAGPWFWPALLAILPKWALKARHYRKEGPTFLRLMARALYDGLWQKIDVSHDEVVALSQSREPRR